MAKNGKSIKAKNSRVRVPKMDSGKLTGKQQFKLQKRALKNETLKIKTKPSLAQSIGKGVAEGTAPIATSMTAQKTAEQYTALKRASADAALAAWNKNIGGNPGEGGAEGSKQGESTTRVTSAGSFSSVLD